MKKGKRRKNKRKAFKGKPLIESYLGRDCWGGLAKAKREKRRKEPGGEGIVQVGDGPQPAHGLFPLGTRLGPEGKKKEKDKKWFRTGTNETATGSCVGGG